MSSIFELHARVRRLRDALSHMKTATALEAEQLRGTLRAGADVETCGEWTALVSELREYMTLAETLAPLRAGPAKKARRPAGRNAIAAILFEPIATFH